MNPPDFICSKCESSMEIGIILDHTYGAITQSSWVEGKPEKSIWTGLKTRGKEHYNVQTYRCTNCGYLESYAVEEAANKSIFE